MLTWSVLAAAGYGVSDFAGGLAARRRNTLNGLAYSQLAGAVLALALQPVAPGRLTVSGVLLAAAAGMCGCMGTWLMYRVMTTAPLSLVSPCTAVLAAVAPVLFGVATGERVGGVAWWGVLAGLLAIVLIGWTKGGGATARRTVLLALGAGAGYGAFFILLAKAGTDDTGLAPVLVARLAGLVLILGLALRLKAIRFPVLRELSSLRALRVENSRSHLMPSLNRLRAADRTARSLMVLAGAADALADAFFFLSTRRGSISLSTMVSALYPAVTVLLAVVLLRERVGWRAGAGLSLSGCALALLAT